MKAARLNEVLDASLISRDPDDLAAHALDWTPGALLRRRGGEEPSRPDVVVRPRTTEEVVTLLAWADATRTPVVPFGGGSSVVAGIAPAGAVVLDLRSLDSIGDVDEKSRHVTVGAGVTGPALDQALRANGYLLGHEPQSLSISTVGGWIATKACGQLSARYGGIENLLKGFEAVIPGGSVLHHKAAPRRSTGPDVAALMIGSEGTLGVITQATLLVSPVPQEKADVCVRFEHMTDGVAACRAIAQSDLTPTLVRLYDAEDAALFLRHHPGETPDPLLLLSFSGDGAGARAHAAVVLSGGREGDPALVEHWWEHRNDAVDEFRRLMAGEGMLGPHAVIDTMEVSGTWSVLRDLYHSMKDALTPLAMMVGCHLSHVYPDGACLYFTLAAAAGDDDEAARVDEGWWRTGMSTCLTAGGSISHHHGIGRLKAPWLEEELGGWFEVLKAVKSAVDPNRVMNPGAFGL